MKKFLVTVAVVLAIHTTSAQKDVIFGGKGGVNIARIITSEKLPETSNGSRFASHIGLFAEAKIGKYMTISPEVLYSKQGNNTVAKTTNIVTSTMYEYINTPVMLKYYVLNYLALELGPQVGFLLKAKRKIGGEIPSEIDIKKETTEIDYGVALGASLVVIERRMMIGIRYYRGIADLDNSNTIQNTSVNSVIQMSLGYAF